MCAASFETLKSLRDLADNINSLDISFEPSLELILLLKILLLLQLILLKKYFQKPNKIINTGKNAILGTGKNKYTIGLIKLSSLSLTPINIPRGYPSIVVINKAISNLKRLAIR